MTRNRCNLLIEVQVCAVLLCTVFITGSGQAQAPVKTAARRQELGPGARAPFPWPLVPETSSLTPAAGPSLPVLGGGTLGRLTKWTGFNGANSVIGDSTIFEDKLGNVGIGTD